MEKMAASDYFTIMNGREFFIINSSFFNLFPFFIRAMRLLAIAGLLSTVLGDGSVFNFVNVGQSLDISTREATLNLANSFGMANEYEIDSNINLNNIIFDNSNVIVVVKGVEEPKEFFSKYAISPEYNFPTGNSVKQLLKKIPRDEDKLRLTNNIIISQSMDYLQKIWKDKVVGVESDLAQLAYFLENEKINDKVIAFMKPSDSLVKLLAENGKATVVVLSDNYENTINFNKRELNPSSNAVLTSSTPGCYANQLACIEQTDSCSGHGICTLSGSGSSCYRCLCSSTEENDRTTYWTGNSCEKVDYSGPFHLIFWTSIIVILLGVSGIKLLSSCGSEELPGVLQAATMQTKKNV